MVLPKVGGTANPGVVPQMRAAIAAAATQANRNLADVGLVIGAVTVVDLDGEAARALARREAALYLSVIADLDHSLNIDPELLIRIKAASAEYDFDWAIIITLLLMVRRDLAVFSHLLRPLAM